MAKMNPREAVAHVLGDSYEDVADREYQRGHTHGVVLYTQGVDYYFAMAVGRNPPARLREDFPDCQFEKLETDTARYCLEQGQQVWVIRQQKAVAEAPPAQLTPQQRLAEIDSSIQYLEAQSATGLDAMVRDGRLQELRAERQRLTQAASTQTAAVGTSWSLRSVHTGNTDSGEYDVIGADGEPVLSIQRINTDAGRAQWKTNLQLVKSAPQLQAMVQRQQLLLQRLIAAGLQNAEVRSAVDDASALLKAIPDSALNIAT